MKKKTTDKDSPGKLYLPHNRIDPFVVQGSTEAGATHYWRWGDDNLFPNALALMARRSTTHRRIINDKADYVSGKGFSFNEGDPTLARFIESANGTGETLRQVFNKLAFDKALFGNAFLEIVTPPERSFLSFYHQDASKCRIAKKAIMCCYTTTGNTTPLRTPNGCRSTPVSKKRPTVRCAPCFITRITNRHSNITACRLTSPA